MPNNILCSPIYRALPLIQVDDLRFFVLDEADRMVEKGHFRELQSIIDALPKQGGGAPAESDPPEEDDTVAKAPVAKHAAQRQTFVFSATLMVPPSLKKKLKGAGKVPMRREQGQVAALIERAGA
jgi:ATP-dependent RNA helicase DDX24/MAK5